MIESIITSKTRIRLLLKFFLNCHTVSYLRELETEFGESSNSIRIELNKLESAGLLISATEGNKKMFYANANHPLFDDIHNIIKKYVGIDQIIDKITSQIEGLEAAYLTDDFATGNDSEIVSLILVGDDLNHKYIDILVSKTELLISRKIKYDVLGHAEIIQSSFNKPILLIWPVVTDK
jgi:hypothetical protein